MLLSSITALDICKVLGIPTAGGSAWASILAYRKLTGKQKGNGKCAHHEGLIEDVAGLKAQIVDDRRSFDKLETKVDQVNDSMVGLYTVVKKIDSDLERRNNYMKPTIERRQP